MDHLFADLPEDLSALTDEELASFIADAQETADRIAENPAEYLVEGRDFAALKVEMTDGVARIEAAKAEQKARADAAETTDDADDDDALAAEREELAALAASTREEPEGEEDADGDEGEAAADPEEAADEAVEEVVEEPVVASAKPAALAPLGRRRLPRPARSRSSEPPPEERKVALTAAAEGLGFGLGAELPDELAIADMMIKRRAQFGRSIPEGTHGDQIPIARADWSSLYPPERMLSADDSDTAKVNAVVADAQIQKAFRERRDSDDALTASGGLCAPVTPYYQLQMLSVANRPVRAALPAFNADRGGIRAARPASLSAITTAVGIRTAAEDKTGGTVGAKTCQVIACPSFTETDVQIIFHCLQFGNLGARTFPELVAQWNSLTLAAHARTAETALLDGIDSNSTQVTAANLGLGASANLLSQALTAAQGMRSRHRMDPNAVLRALYPYWVLDLLVSDVYRTQFERFDMGPDDFVRLLRAGNIEPTFYIDGATGNGQVYGNQNAGALLPFPADVVWYLYPEGSFLYLDGGVLELGLVRDSVLNQSNDFQIFGESFENVAFVGIESLAITSTVCDSGTVSLPNDVNCPIDYSHTS